MNTFTTANMTKWTGGECPVDPETPVIVKLRTLVPSKDAEGAMGCLYPQIAGKLHWDHTGKIGDILAYTVREERKPAPPAAQPPKPQKAPKPAVDDFPVWD